MKRKYKVRVHESGDRDGATASGTIVLHVGGSMAHEASSIEELEQSIRRQVEAGKLARGCVYQICPSGISSERPLAVSAPLAGELRSCLLETAAGLYSEFRRIRYPAPETAQVLEQEVLEEVLV